MTPPRAEFKPHTDGPGAGRTVLNVVTAVAIGTLAVASGWIAIGKAKYADICPDYFAIGYAYIVGPDGRGMDSVSVELKDDVDCNTLYRSFTDSTGRFVLFNDANSFALSRIPTRFRAYVTLRDHADTVVYQFQRYRVCHFRKISGPDTITLDTFSHQTLSALLLENPRPVRACQSCDYQPWVSTTLRIAPPADLREPLTGWRNVRYGALHVGTRSIHLACVYDQAEAGPSGTHQAGDGAFYVLDRNNNGDLNDDTVRPWRLWSDSTATQDADCEVRLCSIVDTLQWDGKSWLVDLQLRGLHGRQPTVWYRRSDAVAGYLTVGGRRRAALLWDFGLSEFRDLNSVLLAIDVNGDGALDCREGSPELLERAIRPFVLDTAALAVKSISPAPTLFCQERRAPSGRLADTRTGAWARDFTATHQQSISLYEACGSHRFVFLYFFEGNAKTRMTDLAVRALVSVARARLGATQLIGIDRSATGEAYGGDPAAGDLVIVENRGWEGPIATQFHNHEPCEVVCLDSMATVVCRGVPGRDFVECLWQRLRRTDAVAALARYDDLLAVRP
jgi:hypothetical protein